MQIHPLTDQLSVSPQITVADLAAIAAAGYRSVINNRPDGEASDQPESAALAEAAARQGLGYRYIPVTPGRYEAATLDAMAQALETLPGPVLAFCRSGTRSTSVWALQAARRADPQVLMKTAAAAGYDLAGLAPQLHAARVA